MYINNENTTVLNNIAFQKKSISKLPVGLSWKVLMYTNYLPTTCDIEHVNINVFFFLVEQNKII